MVRGKPISEEIHQLIVNKATNGKSLQEIGKELGLCKSSIQGVIEFYRKNNSVVSNIKKRGKISSIT